jgi:hypothetical protein
MQFDGEAAGRSPSAILTRVSIGTFAFAVLLTVLTAVLRWGFTPSAGFVRTFYPTGNFQSASVSDDRTTEVSLDFLRQNPSLPRRSFGVQWRGFWYFPEERTLALHVSSNDEVQLLVDSRTVFRRNPRERPQTARRSLTLTKGTHEIVIRYRQHGSGMGLAILSSLSGTAPEPLPATFIFAEPVERHDVVFAAAAPWLMALMGVAWLTAAGLAIAAQFVGPRPNRWRIELATPRVLARRLRLIAGPALLGPIVLFLVGPSTIHAANPEEFVLPFTDIVWPWTIGAIAISWTILLVLGAIACLLSERLAHVCAAVLLAAGLLLWAQGTLLVADYGPFYGEALDLRAHAGRVPYEAVLWAGVLGVVVVYARQVSRVASLLSLLFVGLQVAAVVVALANPMQARGGVQSGWSAPPSELYTLSRSENVIHIVLDAYMSELFGEAVTQDRAFFDRTFSGFVYFADHLGAFPTTRASMPAMLTGEAYRNEEPFEQFRGRTQQRSIATVLAEHGYEVRSITFHRIEHPEPMAARRPVVRYTIPTPYGSYGDYVRFTALQLFDFAAFRYVPQALKASVYNDDDWLWQRALSAGTLESQRSRMTRPSNHAAFLTEMTDRLTAGVDGPVYQFIHVAVPHPPLVLDAGCSFVERGRTTSRRTYAEQSRCAVTMVGKLLDRLRALGLYDQSIIVLTSDHGWRVPRPDHPLAGLATPVGDLQSVALTAMPLLVVKPKHASGPLRVSTAPTTITDIPATIADLAGLPPGLFHGQSAFRIAPDARRSRGFAFHSWRNADWRREYMDALHVFSVDGPIHEPGSWRFRQTIVDPAGAPNPR